MAILPNTPDSLGAMTFITLDDVLERFAHDASRATGGAVGLRFSARRDKAVYFSRVARQLERILKLISAWQAGEAPADFNLAEELQSGVSAIDRLQAELEIAESPYEHSRWALQRMLVQLGVEIT